MKNFKENTDKDKLWDHWCAVMILSIIIWVISVTFLIVTNYESSLAFCIFLISSVVFWIVFSVLLSISAKEPWI